MTKSKTSKKRLAPASPRPSLPNCRENHTPVKSRMSSEKYKMSDPDEDETQDMVVLRNSAETSQKPVIVEVRGLAAGGRGVGRVGPVVWLVDGGLPGDRLLARPVRHRPRWVEAVTAKLVRASDDRRPAPCRIQGRCGGCPWMTLEEGRQRDWKRRIVQETLTRLAGLAGVEVGPTLPSPSSLAYRNKVEFTFGRDASGGPVLGLHGTDRDLVDVERCLLQDESANQVLQTARNYFLEGPGRDEPALFDDREPGRLVIRRSHATGELLVALRSIAARTASARGFARRVREVHPEVVGVALLIGRPGKRGGARTLVLAGRAWIEEELGGTRFRLPASTFFQVNPEAAEQLVRLVLEWSGEAAGRRVLDLYSGVGVFGLALARRGAGVTLCDADAGALRCGQRAARAAGISGLRFWAGDVGAFLRRAAGAADLVIANPPRSGFGRGVAQEIARLGPRAILIVSCDPATLARDVKLLTAERYRLQRAVPVDLFPQTPHIETIALLQR